MNFSSDYLTLENQSGLALLSAFMLYGSLRAGGFRVTREKVRSTLRLIDPIASASRWQARITKRRPYSVTGLNSP